MGNYDYNDFGKSPTAIYEKTFDCCATCAYWSGKTDFIYPNQVIAFWDEREGTCNSYFLNGRTEFGMTCAGWKQRYN